MPVGIPSTYTNTDPRSPPDDTRGKHPSLIPSFALFFINLPIHASTGPFHPLQKQYITADNSDYTVDNLYIRCLDVWPPASFPYRRNIGGHHRVMKAVGRHGLIPMITGTVLVLSLEAPSAGRACTPGPLDPRDISVQCMCIIDIYIYCTSHNHSWAAMWEGWFFS